MPVDSTHPDTLLIDGTDLAAAARIVQVWEGVHVTPGNRGSGLVIPDRDGMVDFDRPFGANTLSLGLLLRGSSDVTGFNDAYRTLRRLVKPGRQVTLTRRQSFTTGTEDHTAAARYLDGLNPTLLTPADGKMVLNFTILDGLWYGASQSIGTGAVTVLGDVRTHRMTVTLTGSGSTTVLSNSANGMTFTYTGSKSTAVVIDVEAMTATQGVTDVSANLSWNGIFPFRLEPGAQTLSVSTGSAAISYRPAYL